MILACNWTQSSPGTWLWWYKYTKDRITCGISLYQYSKDPMLFNTYMIRKVRLRKGEIVNEINTLSEVMALLRGFVGTPICNSRVICYRINMHNLIGQLVGKGSSTVVYHCICLRLILQLPYWPSDWDSWDLMCSLLGWTRWWSCWE